MRAAILSIGDGLIGGLVAERNAHWLSGALSARAVDVVEARIVGDEAQAITRNVQELAGRCETLLVSGGLGTTASDLTRRTLESLLSEIRALPNARGSATGVAGRIEGCTVFAMPGPPAEMRAMFRGPVLEGLALRPGTIRGTTHVHEYGLAESAADRRLRALPLDPGLRLGIIVRATLVTARLQADGPRAKVGTRLAEAATLVENAWAPYAFGRDGTSIAASAGAMLRAQGRRLATAESCTGGWLSRLITGVAGSSDYYRGGMIPYSDDLKMSCLGVARETLEAHGTVSAPCAAAMATGALQRLSADEALAVTGIAGPGGATLQKPVGTVFIALARRAEGRNPVVVRRFRFAGNRNQVRDRAAKSALQMLRFALLGVEPKDKLLWEIPAEAGVAT